MIQLTNISKTFRQGEEQLHILQNLSVDIKKNEKVAIIGASGSGKSTLLSIMACMDKPDAGTIYLDGENVVDISEEKLCQIRNNKIGVVFQAFELIPSFTALENVLLPLDITGQTDIQKATQLLTDLGLSHRLNHLPKMLSGGEQQRVAIARALISDPEIIFADEPTGNLDPHTGEKVLHLLFSQIEKYKKTLVLITHDISLSAKMDRVFNLREGMLHEQQ